MITVNGTTRLCPFDCMHMLFQYNDDDDDDDDDDD